MVGPGRRFPSVEDALEINRPIADGRKARSGVFHVFNVPGGTGRGIAFFEQQ